MSRMPRAFSLQPLKGFQLAGGLVNWCLLVCLVLLLAGCGSDAVYGDEAILGGTAVLDCSRECKIRGSCRPAQGSSDDLVSLGVAPAFPGVSTVVFESVAAGASVAVLETELVTGIEQGSNQELEIRFYYVEDAVSQTAGWAPGFCLLNQVP